MSAKPTTTAVRVPRAARARQQAAAAVAAAVAAPESAVAAATAASAATDAAAEPAPKTQRRGRVARSTSAAVAVPEIAAEVTPSVPTGGATLPADAIAAEAGVPSHHFLFFIRSVNGGKKGLYELFLGTSDNVTQSRNDLSKTHPKNLKTVGIVSCENADAFQLLTRVIAQKDNEGKPILKPYGTSKDMSTPVWFTIHKDDFTKFLAGLEGEGYSLVTNEIKARYREPRQARQARQARQPRAKKATDEVVEPAELVEVDEEAAAEDADAAEPTVAVAGSGPQPDSSAAAAPAKAVRRTRKAKVAAV